MTPGERDSPGGVAPGGGYQPFNVANLLRAQQHLLTAGGHRASGPAGHGPVPDGRGTDDEEFGLRDYLDLLGRRWICVAVPFVAVVALAFVYSSFEPTDHLATSRLLITRSLFGERIADDLIQGNVYVSSTAISQMAKLESVRRLAARSIVDWAAGRESTLGRLWAAPREAGPATGSGEAGGTLRRRWARDKLTDEERRILTSFDLAFGLVSGTVDVIPDTQNVAVAVTCSHSSEVVAAAAADALASAIVETFNSRRWDEASLSLINSQLEANSKELETIDRKITALRSSIPGGEQALEGFPLEIERQFDLLRDHTVGLRSLDSMIEEADEKIAILQKQSTRAEDAPPEDLVQKLIDLELEREQQSSRYTEAHPNMHKLADEIERARRLIEEYPRRRKELNARATWSLGHYDPNVQLAFERARRAGLVARKLQTEESIAAIRREMKTDSHGRSAKHMQLVMEREALQDYSKALRMRLQRAKLARNRRDDRSGGAIEAVPAETRSVGPRHWQTVLLGGIIGLLAGFVLAFLAERLDDSVRVPAEMRVLAGVPTLQVVPVLRRSLVIRPEETVSGIANVFAVLRNNIRYSAQDVPENAILVTSAVAGEGKSLIAVNLAISFAQEGSRTCLVDADVQKGDRHAMEEAVKLSWDPQAGLATYLEGAAEFEHVVVPSVELPHLAYVASGGRAANPPRALRSERAAGFFAGIRQEFDVVVIDSPPVLPVVDAAILAAHCQSVIHVVRYGFTRRQELEESARRLRHVNAPLVGLVLNCAKTAAGSYYYSRHYGQPA